jgi:NAD(P)-dependent dehydrogenase (short-subunit alcohol dehydrogenase family)
VNTVAPGPTVTDAAGWYPENELRADVMTKMAGASKSDKIAGTADEIADAVLLVVSEQARWITGQYVAASGGMTD